MKFYANVAGGETRKGRDGIDEEPERERESEGGIAEWMQEEREGEETALPPFAANMSLPPFSSGITAGK